MADKGKREKNLHRLIQELKNMGPGSNEVIKFIVDKTPSEDDDESLPSGDWIISGRLLPNSDLYKQGSLPARIVVGPTFPVQPPKVLITVPIYHPNVAKDGEVSIDLLNPKGSWKAEVTLCKIVKEVTKIIDEPSIDYIQHTEAASLYDSDKKEYERIASEMFRKHRSPRN